MESNIPGRGGGRPENELSIPTLKINVADSIPYLVPTQVQEPIFSSRNPPKNSGSVFFPFLFFPAPMHLGRYGTGTACAAVYIGLSLFLISPLFPGDHTCIEGAGDNVLMKMNIL